MTIRDAMSISAMGLNVQRVRLNTTASNIANAETTRSPDGGPYRRLDPVVGTVSFTDALDDAVRGVEVLEIQADSSAPRQIFDPDHPDANEQGMVALPNVNLVEEMVNLITEQRAFEANSTAFKTAKELVARALDLLR